MSDNVIILGAGFSHDAGIPLLGNFIERMWEYSIKKKIGDDQIPFENLTILQKALAIRSEMDGYHGRVAFDDRNIEDILSMLAFNQQAGGTKEKNKLDAFTDAISTTIELSCKITHPGLPKNNSYTIIDNKIEVYKKFWTALFKWYGTEKQIPTIITFNYDLVLERSLYQVLINTIYDSHNHRVPFKDFSIDYQYPFFPPQIFEMSYATYGGYSGQQGTIFKKADRVNLLDGPNIEILKLHGSLNFPKARAKEGNLNLSYTQNFDNPYIVPPISNKQTANYASDIWKTALLRLRNAKNVIFVGYSLPKTDVFMQFFLKAALGPNQELNKLFIFDPILWTDKSEKNEMMQRYGSCFSDQLKNRIIFKPPTVLPLDKEAGTTKHFVSILDNDPTSILF